LAPSEFGQSASLGAKPPRAALEGSRKRVYQLGLRGDEVAVNRDRAVLFIDGNNWYHYLKRSGITNLLRLDYAKISQKLVGPPRDWIGSRYYIGQVDQRQGAQVYADQRKFIDALHKTDSRITVHLGRIEPRETKSEAASELLRYMHALKTKIDPQVFRDLVSLGTRYEKELVWVEKAVDVHLAVDLVVMGITSQYDAAYVLSADGDYTKAVDYVRQSLGKDVYAACPGHGAQLASTVKSFIHLKPDWFLDCYT
jgi:uncharacterized LabA/DUF88 family protein